MRPMKVNDLLSAEKTFQVLWNYFIEIIQDCLDGYVITEDDTEVKNKFRLKI
jgi:hypothetical protein